MNHNQGDQRSTTIVIADDHQVVRHGLRALLEAEADFRVIGEAEDGLATNELVERLKPDILVLDIVMPGLNGIEICRRAARESPNTRVVILSMYDNEAYVLEALRAGAEGYVLKRSTTEELVDAIREVAAGRRYLGKPLSRSLIETYMDKVDGPLQDSYDILTAREREIMQMTAEGLTSTEIAERLSISFRTVENHRANLMHKLGLRTQTDLIRYAFRRGIIRVEE